MAAAFAIWSPRLPDQPFRLLTYMALAALDEDRPNQPARRYWGGRDALAGALGRRVQLPPTIGDHSEAAQTCRRERTAAYQAVKSALLALREAGAITRVRDGRIGQQSEYELHLDLLLQGKDEPPPEGKGEPPPEGKGEPPPEGKGEPPRGEGSPSSEGKGEPPPEEYRGTIGTPPGTDHLTAFTHLRIAQAATR